MTRRRCRAVLVVGLVALLLPVRLVAEEPAAPSIVFDFEEPSFLPGNLHDQRGWWVDQGVVTVVPGIGLDGSAALSVDPSEDFSQGRLSLVRPAAAGSDHFLDFQVRLPAAGWLALDESFDIDSARIGLFRTHEDPSVVEWHVFHGNGEGDGMWLNTGVAAAVDPLTDLTIGWTRLTIRQDLSSQSWDLWVDGLPTAMGLGFQFPPEPDQLHFYVLGHTQLPVLLDEVRVWAGLPPGLSHPAVHTPEPEPEPGGPAPPGSPPGGLAGDAVDSDADGLPDAWELAHGLNPHDPADAASDVDGDGLTALDEFLLGSDATRKDIRRAVVSQAAEVFNRFAGVSPRRAVVPAP